MRKILSFILLFIVLSSCAVTTKSKKTDNRDWRIENDCGCPHKELHRESQSLIIFLIKFKEASTVAVEVSLVTS